jgi:hypothetical protein
VTNPTEIRVAGRTVVTIDERQLEEFSAQWELLAATRARWYSSSVDTEAVRRRLRDDFAELGIANEALEELTRANEIEVSIPIADSNTWSWRTPWEYAFPLVSSREAGDLRQSVVRHVRQAPRSNLRSEVRRVLLIESAPGIIGLQYGFARERHVVIDCFKVAAEKVLQSFGKLPSIDSAGTFVFVLTNPTKALVADAVRQFAPDVVHVTGVDSREAADMLNSERTSPPGKPAEDGFVLADADGQPAIVSATDLAAALTCGAFKPRLVSFNCFYSSGQLTLAAVQHGAAAAVGFLDTYDNARVESFFDELYRGCLQAEWAIPVAYIVAGDAAWDVGDPTQLIGSVLWNAEPLGDGVSLKEPVHRLRKQRRQARSAPIEVQSVADQVRAELSSIVTVDVQPHAELNYSALHNRGGVFKKFALRKHTQGALPSGLKITVTMRVGTHNLEYHNTVTPSDITEELAPDIRLPLTWSLGGVIHEAIRTTIHTVLECGDYVPIERTDSVTLLPHDEWRDADPDRAWLPSFILPRDAAVSDVLAIAQRYLPALFDDASASFDGYQRADNGGRTLEESVDLQVRAIWAALSYDVCPAYMTPPPTYTPRAQRIRTPAEILRRKRGTCIDLALLMAACLEYVEIYPVIFLLTGHAFPGYWRSPEGYSSFREATKISPESAEQMHSEVLSASTNPRWWMLERGYYSELMERVYQGDLIPLETTLLARRSSFKHAAEEGLRNLKSKSDFEYLLDVNLARDAGVRPIPTIGQGDVHV